MNVRGHGLGLSICKKICENLGGSIQVFSTQGYGSEFIFTMAVQGLKFSKSSNDQIEPGGSKELDRSHKVIEESALDILEESLVPQALIRES